MPAASPVLSVRVTPGERDLLTQAADQARTTVSDFVRRRALEAAEMDIMDHRVVTIPAADWEKFEAWATRPPAENAALRALLATKPAWAD
jgi:uncharacterized protein (DUF1778 family)